MIDYLSGIIRHKESNRIILDVAGVGYGLELPLSVFCQLPELNKECSLWIFTRVREDSFKLYGFLKQEEKNCFSILLNINGVGPKVALAILSTLTPAYLRHAVEQKDSEALQNVPGIGKRTAEKILLELKTKVEALSFAGEEVSNNNYTSQSMFVEASPEKKSLPLSIKKDLSSALENLGFKEKDIKPILKYLQEAYDGQSFSEIIKLALAKIANNRKQNTEFSPSKLKEERASIDLDQLF